MDRDGGGVPDLSASPAKAGAAQSTPQAIASVEFADGVSGAAAALAVVEVGLGSALHALRVPLGGHVLSLNQGFFLSRVTHQLRARGREAARAAVYVAQISALLKSLSPAGDKLGPMLSIGMQGALFALPVALLGPNLAGIALGMVALSLWAFVQPFITLYVFFGHGLLEAVGFYFERMQKAFGASPESIRGVILVAFGIKAVTAVVVGLAGARFSDARVAKLGAVFSRRLPAGALGAALGGAARVESCADPTSIAATMAGRARLALRDLLRPFFLASLGLMAVFFYFAEGPGGRVAWQLLRPLGIAFVFFYLSRSPALRRIGTYLRGRPGSTRFMALFDETLARAPGLNGAPPPPPSPPPPFPPRRRVEAAERPVAEAVR